MAYYKRLKSLREDNNFTQKEIAEKLFTTQPQYYRYESGYRNLPCELVIILAEIYNVSIDYILGLSDEPRKLFPKNRLTAFCKMLKMSMRKQ